MRSHSKDSATSSSNPSAFRSKSIDSLRSLHVSSDVALQSTQSGTWSSAFGQNPFSDQYATLGSETYLNNGEGGTGISTFNSISDGAHSTPTSRPPPIHNSDATASRPVYAASCDSHGASAYGGDEAAVERQSVRSEPASVAAHSIVTEATLASSSGGESEQSDRTTIASIQDRKRLTAGDLSRASSATNASSSEADAPQFFPVKVNPAQLFGWKNRKVS